YASLDVVRGTLGTLRKSTGETRTEDASGTRVLTVLTQFAHIPKDFIDSVTIPRGDAPGSVEISGDEVRDGFGGDPLGPRDATLSQNGNGAHLFRPLRDQSDVNELDQPRARTGEDLLLQVQTKNQDIRDVVVHAARTDIKKGDDPGLTAVVRDAPNGVG